MLYFRFRGCFRNRDLSVFCADRFSWAGILYLFDDVFPGLFNTVHGIFHFLFPHLRAGEAEAVAHDEDDAEDENDRPEEGAQQQDGDPQRQVQEYFTGGFLHDKFVQGEEIPDSLEEFGPFFLDGVMAAFKAFTRGIFDF